MRTGRTYRPGVAFVQGNQTLSLGVTRRQVRVPFPTSPWAPVAQGELGAATARPREGRVKAALSYLTGLEEDRHCRQCPAKGREGTSQAAARGGYGVGVSPIIHSNTIPHQIKPCFEQGLD